MKFKTIKEINRDADKGKRLFWYWTTAFGFCVRFGLWLGAFSSFFDILIICLFVPLLFALLFDSIKEDIIAAKESNKRVEKVKKLKKAKAKAEVQEKARQEKQISETAKKFAERISLLAKAVRATNIKVSEAEIYADAFPFEDTLGLEFSPKNEEDNPVKKTERKRRRSKKKN